MQNSDVPKGTTTIGVACNDGVILAADMRATMGSFIANKTTDKVLEVQKHIAMTIAGGVGDAQTLARLLRSECSLYEMQRKKKIPVKGASTLLGTVLQQSKYYPYWVQVLVGGMDNNSSHLYSVDMAGGVMSEVYVSTGSGSLTAYGVLEDRFKKGKSVEENIPMVISALNAAMQRDSASGDGINLAIIDNKGFRKLTQEQIKTYVTKKE